MSFEVNVKDFMEIIAIVVILKMVLVRWKPPVQESLQALICIVLGTGVGWLLNPTQDGLILGVIVSGVAFYGKSLITEFTELKEDIQEGLEENDIHLK